MLSLGSTYLIVKDFEESIKFYESLLEMKVTSQNFNRWAQFNFGDSCIALFNPKYDEERLTRETDIPNVYSREYLKVKKNKVIKYGNNFVLNFYIDDLEKEYERIKNLGIGKITEILFVNVKWPYYFFTLEDPDGNTIEITGKYPRKEKVE